MFNINKEYSVEELHRVRIFPQEGIEFNNAAYTEHKRIYNELLCKGICFVSPTCSQNGNPIMYLTLAGKILQQYTIMKATCTGG